MKAIGLSLLVCVLVPVVALAQEGKAELNTITSVTVKGGTVEIVGTKKPNFTTFTMTDPPRLVIDISEAVFSGVKEDQAVGNGTISGIRTASYGSDESAIARVLIGYEREVETDIQATGNSLVVNVQGGGGAAVAARPTAPMGTAPAGTAPAGTAPAGTAPAGTGTTPGGNAEQATVAAQVDRQAQERAAANATAAAQVDRQAQERAAADAAAAAKADAEARKQSEARAAADRKAQEEAARVAAQQAEKERLQQEREAKAASAASEKQRREEEARAAAEEKKRQQAEAQASAAEDKKRQQAEERERQRAEAQAAAEEKKRQQQESRQTRVAQAETPRAEPRQGDRVAGSSGRTTMTLVGFAQEPSASRVFLRTTQPVEFNVTEGEKVVFVVLENTGIAESNNTRPLDTSFFDTAVTSVVADAGPSRTVRVSIRLKEQVSYQTRQNGNELSIEFQRPARR
ncbi:AMIN domain-containing protein [Archangium sp.]|uniref:AMIN domain-containing protein n=1 Tax=Archangium sp. TaxID=1872627 RepID=UPI00286A112C|nr:AMIN domain-containing protein [Archangium sp.]